MLLVGCLSPLLFLLAVVPFFKSCLRLPLPLHVRFPYFLFFFGLPTKNGMLMGTMGKEAHKEQTREEAKVGR